jgi:hypothetical protein
MTTCHLSFLDGNNILSDYFIKIQLKNSVREDKQMEIVADAEVKR